MKNNLSIFNKILDRSFPKKLNTVSIVSIPKNKKKKKKKKKKKR